ncbi:hypothetical protein Tco_0489621 [Tanacetum coccineum]
MSILKSIVQKHEKYYRDLVDLLAKMGLPCLGQSKDMTKAVMEFKSMKELCKHILLSVLPDMDVFVEIMYSLHGYSVDSNEVEFARCWRICPDDSIHVPEGSARRNIFQKAQYILLTGHSFDPAGSKGPSGLSLEDLSLEP